MAALERVTLDVSPRLSPDEVADLYRPLRRLLRGASYRSKPTKQESNTLLLAAFVAEHNDGRSWSDAQGAWDKAHPRRRYKDPRAFVTAARRAYEHVTGRRLDWSGKETR